MIIFKVLNLGLSTAHIRVYFSSKIKDMVFGKDYSAPNNRPQFYQGLKRIYVLTHHLLFS